MQARKEIPFNEFARLEQLQTQLYQAFFAITEEIGRLKADIKWERKALHDITRKAAEVGTLPMKEAAKRLHVSVSALSRNPKHLHCVNQGRIDNGGKVEYIEAVVNRHREQTVAGSKCGNCYLVAKDLLQIKLLKK
jgi:hypothetical protein